ncbi:hypothetical protein [Syntrophomonas zehnderi]|uniref:hypothetical protein n=1 Tax=Syntrophomonas zehnderi TaxID=404335 RepID=UPI000AF98BCF|nr:hypothetical protein [Syntrophomonas zehnderi]
MRKKTDIDIKTPVSVDSDITKKELRRNWARLIQKVYYTATLIVTKGNISSARRVIRCFVQNAVGECVSYPLSKTKLSSRRY